MAQFVQKCKEKFFSLVRGGGGKRGLRRNLVKSILTISREKSVLTKVVQGLVFSAFFDFRPFKGLK